MAFRGDPEGHPLKTVSRKDKMEITDEMQAVIDAAVEAATEKLKNKNTELLGEVRTLKSAKTAAEQAAETAAEEAQRQAGDITALETTLNNKHAKALKALEDQLSDANKRLSTMLIDDAITKGLVSANVPAKWHKALTSQFKAEAAISDGVAKIGDEALGDYLTSYFKTDEGKEWVSAPLNVGTGASGVRNSVADEWTKKPSTPEEQLRFAKLSSSDPVLFNSLCDRFGEPERKV